MDPRFCFEGLVFGLCWHGRFAPFDGFDIFGNWVGGFAGGCWFVRMLVCFLGKVVRVF